MVRITCKVLLVSVLSTNIQAFPTSGSSNMSKLSSSHNVSKKAMADNGLEQEWDADLYQDQHSFVWKYGASIVEDLLDPKPNERILDVGCGTGELTKAIADRGATAIGIDFGADMIRTAQAQFSSTKGLTFFHADAHDFELEEPVDAIFSNAALHWVTDAERAVESMARALKLGGRFVVELGGRGNIHQIVEATMKAKAAVGIETKLENPWYFPSIAEYSSILERHGIEVTSAALFDRPTVLGDGEAGLTNWLEMFGDAMLGDVADPEIKAKIISHVNEELREKQWDGEKWTADYRRLRIVGKKIF